MRIIRHAEKVSRDTSAICFCGDVGILEAGWVYAREDICTCGAGDPHDPETAHEPWCDSVMCPFCPENWATEIEEVTYEAGSAGER